MQGLGISRGDCTIGIENSAIGTSSYAGKESRAKSIYRSSISNQNSIFNENLKGLEENGLPDNFFISGELSGRNTLSKNANEELRNVNLKDIHVLANQNRDQLNAILKLTNGNDFTQDLIKRLTDGANRTNDVFFGSNKIREIVSTSRSGHLIERRTKSGLESSEEDVSTERALTGDTSDKDESDNCRSQFKIGDINDNTSDGTLSQVRNDFSFPWCMVSHFGRDYRRGPSESPRGD